MLTLPSFLGHLRSKTHAPVKTEPIIPACVEWRDGVPFAPAFGDVYHARAGAFEQAREVFLAGNGLPARWQGRERFVVLETGFGLGNNFLATWAAWRADPARSGRLEFLSVEKHPLRPSDLRQAHAASPAPDLAEALVQAWPPLVHGLHRLEFDDGRVVLHLAFGDIATWLPEWVASVDAIYLDGFAPSHNSEMWDAAVLRQLARLSAPGATAATWSAARPVRGALAVAGFRPQRVPGFGGKREMTVATLDAEAAARRRPPPPGRRAAPRSRTALVVGAGLAGAAAAWALARQGLQVTVLDGAPAAATGASGNPAGLFHGVVHAHDGAHAQLLRAAAVRAEQLYRRLLGGQALPGAVTGLLRGAWPGDAHALQSLVDAQALPPDYAQVLDGAAASALAGCPLPGAAWHFPGGGWLQPPALAAHWLREAEADLRLGTPVARLAFDGQRWQAVGAAGELLAEADTAVVAAAQASPGLLGPHADAEHWPWRHNRGQVTVLDAQAAAGLPRPARPVASGGYVIALPDAMGAMGAMEAMWAGLGGGLVCGATAHEDDDEPALREADHRANLAQLPSLVGADPSLIEQVICRPGVTGRVGWRVGFDDRLPVVGPVPANAPGLQGAHRLEQPRQVPRVAGLYVLTGLGSRGITWAPLLADTLAAWVTGAPSPLPSSLLDAIDPARFVSRGVRRAVRP